MKQASIFGDQNEVFFVVIPQLIALHVSKVQATEAPKHP